MFINATSLKYLHDLYMHAKNRGLKSTYYLRNRSATEIEKSTAIENDEGNNVPTSNSDEMGSNRQACSIVDPTCESCQ